MFISRRKSRQSSGTGFPKRSQRGSARSVQTVRIRNVRKVSPFSKQRTGQVPVADRLFHGRSITKQGVSEIGHHVNNKNCKKIGNLRKPFQQNSLNDDFGEFATAVRSPCSTRSFRNEPISDPELSHGVSVRGRFAP